MEFEEKREREVKGRTKGGGQGEEEDRHHDTNYIFPLTDRNGRSPATNYLSFLYIVWDNGELRSVLGWAG